MLQSINVHATSAEGLNLKWQILHVFRLHVLAVFDQCFPLHYTFITLHSRRVTHRLQLKHLRIIIDTHSYTAHTSFSPLFFFF